MKAEVARREIESLDYYLQNHTDDYSEESHTAMMMAISALSENKGEWHCSDDIYEFAVCSLCKEDIGEPFKYAKEHFNYCPNCGADMRGE